MSNFYRKQQNRLNAELIENKEKNPRSHRASEKDLQNADRVSNKEAESSTNVTGTSKFKKAATGTTTVLLSKEHSSMKKGAGQ